MAKYFTHKKKEENGIIEIIKNEIVNVLDLIKKIIENFFIQNILFFFYKQINKKLVIINLKLRLK